MVEEGGGGGEGGAGERKIVSRQCGQVQAVIGEGGCVAWESPVLGPPAEEGGRWPEKVPHSTLLPPSSSLPSIASFISHPVTGNTGQTSLPNQNEEVPFFTFWF